MTKQEIDEAVFQKLGNIQVKHPVVEAYYPPIPGYSTDISAAWEIVATLAADAESKGCGPMIEVSHDGQWHCKIGLVVAQADTAPMAICLAFLKLSENVSTPPLDKQRNSATI